MHYIKNGGLEAGLLAAVSQDRPLTAEEQQRLDYVARLPTDQRVALNADGMAVSLRGAARLRQPRKRLISRTGSGLLFDDTRREPLEEEVPEWFELV